MDPTQHRRRLKGLVLSRDKCLREHSGSCPVREDSDRVQQVGLGQGQTPAGSLHGRTSQVSSLSLRLTPANC